MALDSWLPPDYGRLFVAGLVGAIVSFRNRPFTSVIEGIIRILGGAGAAMYLSPLFVPLFEAAAGVVGSTRVELMTAFIVGYLGLEGVSAVLVAFQAKAAGVVLRRTETIVNERDILDDDRHSREARNAD